MSSPPACIPGRNGATKKDIVEWVSENISPSAAKEAKNARNKTELAELLPKLISDRETKTEDTGERKEELKRSPSVPKKEQKEEYKFEEYPYTARSENFQPLFRAMTLPSNKPSKGWSGIGWLPSTPGATLFMFMDGDQIVAIGNTTVSERLVSVDRIDIHPRYQGKRLCKPFLKRIISRFRKSGYTDFVINVASDEQDGVPACLCYYRAARELGFDVFYYPDIEHTKLLPLPDERRCFSKETNQMDLLFRLSRTGV